jgi:hypothetical protein
LVLKESRARKALRVFKDHRVNQVFRVNRARLVNQGHRVNRVYKDYKAQLVNQDRKVYLVYILAQKTQETIMMFGLTQKVKLLS